MYRSSYKTCIPLFVLIFFGLQVIFSSPDSYGQGFLKTTDVPGGGGGSASQTEDTGGGSSGLLIAGVVIIAGLLVYKLVIDKDDSKKKEKQDSTSQKSLLLRAPKNILSEQFSKHPELTADIPLNIYVGFQRFDPCLHERKFIMGISYSF